MGDARFGTWRGEDQMIGESEGGQAKKKINFQIIRNNSRKKGAFIALSLSNIYCVITCVINRAFRFFLLEYKYFKSIIKWIIVGCEEAKAHPRL
jgi:hypothetical protein